MFDDYFDWEGRSDDMMWVGIQRAGVDDPWVWIETGAELDNYYAWYNQPNADDGVTSYNQRMASSASWSHNVHFHFQNCAAALDYADKLYQVGSIKCILQYQSIA